MRHITSGRIVVVVVALAVGCAGLWTAGLGAASAAPGAGTDCPKDPLPLPANGLAPASTAALEAQRSRYEDLGSRPLVARAALAEFDNARGLEAHRDCGLRVQRRTVVVYLEAASRSFRRRNPSLSQGVVLVSRVPGDLYRVWRVVR